MVEIVVEIIAFTKQTGNCLQRILIILCMIGSSCLQ